MLCHAKNLDSASALPAGVLGTSEGERGSTTTDATIAEPTFGAPERGVRDTAGDRGSQNVAGAEPSAAKVVARLE